MSFPWEKEDKEVDEKVEGDNDKHPEKDERADINMLKSLHLKMDRLLAKFDKEKYEGEPAEADETKEEIKSNKGEQMEEEGISSDKEADEIDEKDKSE